MISIIIQRLLSPREVANVKCRAQYVQMDHGYGMIQWYKDERTFSTQQTTNLVVSHHNRNIIDKRVIIPCSDD